MKRTNIIVLLFLLAMSATDAWAETFYTAKPDGTAPVFFEIDFVTVGDPGNADDTSAWNGTDEKFGGVAYEYRISKTEITDGQMSAFFYSVGDTVDLSSTMAAGGRNTIHMLEYANWLNSGCLTTGLGMVDGGVYNMDWTSVSPWPVEDQWDNGDGTKNIWRHKDAKYFLPTDDELVKAAFYKGGSTDAGYWYYPTSSDTAPTAEGASSGTNSANYAGSGVGAALAVGSYPNTQSPCGALDMAGNLWEGCEVRYSAPPHQYVPGWAGCYVHGASWLHGIIGFAVGSASPDLGFRIAATVPESVVVLPADFSDDGTVDIIDLAMFSEQWLMDE